MIKNKQGTGDEKEVLPRVLSESPSDKVTFKQESERKFQGKAWKVLWGESIPGSGLAGGWLWAGFTL